MLTDYVICPLAALAFGLCVLAGLMAPAAHLVAIAIEELSQ